MTGEARTRLRPGLAAPRRPVRTGLLVCHRHMGGTAGGPYVIPPSHMPDQLPLRTSGYVRASQHTGQRLYPIS